MSNAVFFAMGDTEHYLTYRVIWVAIVLVLSLDLLMQLWRLKATTVYLCK